MKYNDKQISGVIREVLEQKKISVKELSIKTKIEYEFVKAIINEEYKKLPSGPYKSLFIKDILKYLNIDIEEYLQKQKNIVKDSGIEKKSDIVTNQSNENLDLLSSKISDIEEKKIEDQKSRLIDTKNSLTNTDIGKSSKFGYLFLIFIILLSVFLYKKFYVVNQPSQINENVSIKTSDSISQIVKKDTLNVLDSSIKKIKNDSLVKKDTLKIKKKLRPRAKITSYRKWNEPKGKYITKKRLKSRYNKGVSVTVKAIGNGVKVKYITKNDFWWRKIKKGDEINFSMKKAIYFDVYHPDSTIIIYKNKKQILVNALYARYVIGVNTGLKLKDIFQ